MRLRYLHLPRCGPLNDTGVVFGREDLIARTLNLPRKGSLNFVVGVNGSGKSSLLRALYRIFRSMKNREWPSLPVTLAWDTSISGETVTAVLHCTTRNKSSSFFAILKKVPDHTRRHDWEDIALALSEEKPHPLIDMLGVITGPEAITSSMLFSHLPKHLIAYTSGSKHLWMQLDQPVFHPKDEEEGLYQPEDERPQGWSIDKEWEEEQPLRIANVLSPFAPKISGAVVSIADTKKTGESFRDIWDLIHPELTQLSIIRHKVAMNRLQRKERLDDAYFIIQPGHLRFAGITLALWQTTKELSDRPEENQREALRNAFLQHRDTDDKPQGVRRVLNDIDWFWPTHLSLTYLDADYRVSLRQHQELLCLVALADEVVAQPRGRQRAVFSLAPSGQINLTEKLNNAFPFGIPSKEIEYIAERVDGSKTMAEAILRVFSAGQNIDSTPMDVFTRLRDWERTGLLEDVTLTVKRLHRHESANGESDDTIVTYDQLSDGEQMLLGRMGLIFLLRGQDGSLLLLDEPETHFNDVWKREIVEMINTGLLNSTEANVVVATHTSIALTDAFAAEVTVMDKTEEGIKARGVTGGLFGTDPGEVNMNLFRADSSIGRRSVELLDQLLETEWKGREGELEAILNVLGSSFHRAELRAVLKNLRAKNNGAASS